MSNRSQLKAFISYRRADNRTFVKYFRQFFIHPGGYEPVNIFMDFTHIPAGVPFADYIRGVVQDSHVLIAMIGTQWLSLLHQRLAKSDEDFVRIEIELAHQAGLRIIPILYDGAAMPSKADLPESLQFLPELHGQKFEDEDPLFAERMERLIFQELDKIRLDGHQPKPISQPKVEPPSENFDVDEAVERAFQLAKEKRWTEAEAFVNSLLKSPYLPDWAQQDLEEAILPVIQIEIQRQNDENRRKEKDEDCRKKYRRLVNKVEINAPHVAEQFEAFLKDCGPHYDVANLYERVFGPTTSPTPKVEVTPPPPKPTSWRDHLTDEQRRLIGIIENPDKTPPERAEAGRRLADIGDPRPGVGLRPDGLPDFSWVEIAGGKYVIGGDDNAYQSLPRQEITLKAFQIARYPVTYAQYEAFVNSDGYTNPVYWTKAGLEWKSTKTHPEYGWKEAKWHIPNHPVIGVTWYEAYAFTQWAKAKLGQPIRLLIQEEWEAAARGTKGNFYPWGNEYRSGYANINETYNKVGEYYLQRTTAVGIYPQGQTLAPQGIYDLSGNVWEWCLSVFSDGSIDINNSASRVLRGGSWYGDEQDARAASRYDHYLGLLRNRNVGFRVGVFPFS